MPYSITTKDGITINNIPDDVAPDSQMLKDRVAKIRAGGNTPETAAAPAPQERGALADVGRQLGLTARHAIEGVAGGAGAFIDPVISAIGGGVRAATGGNYDPATLAGLGRGAADVLGLPQPETAQERIVGAATRGLAGAGGGIASAAQLAARATGPVKSAAQTLASQPGLQAVSGAAAGTSGQAAAESGASPAQQLAASLVGGVGGAVLGGATARAVQAARTPAPAPPPGAPTITPLPPAELAAVTRTAAEGSVGGAMGGAIGSKSATRTLAEQTIPDPKIIESAKRLGIADYLQPDHVTTNQAYRELAQAVKSVPGSTTRAAELEGLEAIAKRADKLIDEFGGSSDLSKLDAGIKSRMKTTQGELEKKADALYADLRANIPARADAPAPSVLQFIQNRADDLGGMENLSSMERTIFRKLKPVEQLDDAGNVISVKQPTYALLDDVRRDMTAARVKRQGPFKDADTGLIKRLEMSLKDDQGAAITPYGMSDKFKAAQNAVAVRKGLEDDMVALFGKQLDRSIIGDLSGSLAALPKGDTSKLINMLKAIPEDMRQETVASGLSTAFNISAKNQKLSFTNFANWYDGLLKNKQAHTALMTNLPPEARKQLSDLYRVSKGISLATKERITTGRIMSVQEELRGADNLMANIYSLAKRSAAGLGAEAVTTGIGMPGAGLAAGIASALTKGKPNTIKAADALISSPEFAAAIRAVGTPAQRSSAAQLAASRAFKEFSRSVKDPRIISNPEQWVLRAISSSAIDDTRQEALAESQPSQEMQ